MSIGERIKIERERLGMSQTAFGALGNAGKTTVISWERGTAFPNAAFLSSVANAGIDVLFVITGIRSPSVNKPDEQLLLEGYRSLDQATQRRMLAFMLGGMESPIPSVPQALTVTASGHGTQAAGRKIVNKGKS